jgi:MFS family permease
MTLVLSARQRSLIGVIAAMAVVNLVYGITFPLLALVLDSQGISKTLIGLNTIVQAAAVIAIAPFAPRWLSRYAPSRLMQVMSVILAVLFIIAGLFPNVWFWFPLRFLIGGCTAMLWISSEALINKLATERWRGRIIGIYSAMGAAGFALGPLLLVFTGSNGMLPFVATCMMILLASLPLFLVQHFPLVYKGEAQHGIWKVFLLAPVIMLANVAYAASAESIITFFPLYGMTLGMSQEFALGLMTIIGAGGMILVMPLGWLADHVNRMGMLVCVLILTMAGLLAFPHVLTMSPTIIYLFVFVFGGIEGMIYTLGVVLIGQRFKGSLLAAATTSFTACWGAGTVLGPLLAGVGMDWLGDESLMYIVFAFFLLYLPFPVVAFLRSLRSLR